MSDRETAGDATTGRSLGDVESEPGEGTELCWICQRPITAVEPARWRGEPIHPDCLIHEPKYVSD